MKKIIFRLDEILKQKGRGVHDLSRSTSISYATISRIVNNRNRGISLDTLANICQELNIQAGDLFKEVEFPDKEIK